MQLLTTPENPLLPFPWLKLLPPPLAEIAVDGAARI